MGGSRKKVRIVYIIGTLVPGGAERHVVELVKELDKDLFEPIVYCLREKGALASQVEQIGVPVKVMGIVNCCSRLQFMKLILKVIWKMRNALKEDRPHIVHTYLYWANVYGVIAAKLAGIENIVTSRRSLGAYKDRKPWLQWIENMTNIFADVVTANSKEVYNDTLQREKFIAKKLTLIYNGVNESTFKRSHIDTESLRRKLHIPENHYVVTNVANLHSYKGHLEFVEAAAAVLRRQSNVCFLLVGRDAGMQSELERLVKHWDIADKVKFLGVRQDMVDILNITDIQVLSSYEEGFSNAILEGMACSLPLVVTRVGGNPEAVIDNFNGYVVLPRNSDQLKGAIMKLLSDHHARVAMGERGRKRVEELFTLKVMAQNYREMYCKLDKAIGS
ncbi:glycosyltransferase [Paenibacillus ginsengarvi]|uniref:Glycosyltransferase n=1 Tax=Paenibacillus ginsengarvi TaxID=400777 RepID=A0A3B0CLP2_9BACL|nr:glycosyltransferase [Paenibacillus ginsengarvi]RKN85658.1 glycosyltransferase [Paenibacillus ginsengarvi]